MSDEFLDRILSCPECGKTLASTADSFNCTHCHTRFPVLDSMPWLIAQPDATLAEWKAQLKFLLQSLERDAEEIKGDLQLPGLMASTVKRLRKQLQAKVEQRKLISDLLAPLDLKSTGSHDLGVALKVKLPKTQSLISYYTNIHRDWVWGDEENKASMQCILNILGDERSLGNLLVSGAGSCRLLYDISEALRPSRVVGIDINPLLFLSAHKILRGQSVKLYEFPIAPINAESYSCLRKCKAPEKISVPATLIFADTLNLPFLPGSFETVLTPWLIDIIPESPETFFLKLNQVLVNGGRWLNFGSLVYQHKRPAQDFSKEEIIELVHQAGFTIERQLITKIPYMQSPLSHHGRIEEVFCFAARKIRDVEVPKSKFTVLPPWLMDANKSVPNSPEFESLRNIYGIYLDVVKAIDGENSLSQIAAKFAPKYGLSHEEALQSITRYLARTVQDMKS